MITFFKESLINSRYENFKKNYNIANFFVWLFLVCTTIISIVMLWFFSISKGLLLQSIALLFCAIYYCTISIFKERLLNGFYQKVTKLSISADKKGLTIQEVFEKDAKSYFVFFNEIVKIKEFSKFITIKLKDKHFLILPNTKDGKEIFNTLERTLNKNYKKLL